MMNHLETTQVTRKNNAGIIKFEAGASNVAVLSLAGKGDECTSPTTPLSPSSIYSISEIRGLQNSIISCILLSSWDHILGPRIQHLWPVENGLKLNQKTLSYVCGQTLSGEICRDARNNNIDMKFYNLPENGLIVPSFLFSAVRNSDTMVYSLSLMISSSDLGRYLGMHDMVQKCFQRLVEKLRILINKSNFLGAIAAFTKYMQRCMKMFSVLCSDALPKHIELSSTAFASSHILEPNFLHQCIASHLMTFGRSYVIGETAEKVNLVISTLALFNHPKERQCSLGINLLQDHTYHHDLYIQGDIKKSGMQFEIPMKEIFRSKYPTTVIDVDSRQVQQSPLYPDHVACHCETLKNDLICLYYGDFEDIDIVIRGRLAQASEIPDTLVTKLLEELALLPSVCGIREAYLSQFVRVLHKKAHCLIKYIEAETNQGSQPLRSGLKRIRQDLGLTMEGDFRIVLATAEKLRPGMYHYLLGGRDFSCKQGIVDSS